MKLILLCATVTAILLRRCELSGTLSMVHRCVSFINRGSSCYVHMHLKPVVSLGTGDIPNGI